ncbi:MAG: DNA methylase [Eubacteriales bacterium]|nr:DNA methylase [Eubacteriales bacterium]
MNGAERIYLAIDLKSFYASVECRERGLDPMTTNLVVADESRTEKTICLAVSPSLKAYGISGRARLFEVIQRVREVNGRRRAAAPGGELTGSSWDDRELSVSPELAVSYITAPPRMAHYIRYSTQIYQIYLKYVAPEDMHVYSIDEVFLDVTQYLGIYGLTPRELAGRICLDVLETTGITAAAGIGTNLYLCKAAMDIVAKHIAPDQNGVRIASLNEREYRRLLWSHRPLTDFWRVGRGYEKKLEEHGLFTMGDIARCSLGGPGDYHNEELLYRLFGVNAELLIDHAWGWEPCTIADIRAYRPENNSLVSGQVLHCGYDFEKARLVLREMADQMALDLVEKNLVTDQLVLTISYDREALTGSGQGGSYKGEITQDRYGRDVPKPAHGTINLKRATSSSRLLTEAAVELYDRIMNRRLTVRKLSISANHVVEQGQEQKTERFQQMDLFTDYEELEAKRQQEEESLEREKRLQKTMLDIRKKFGKNAILKGMNLEEGATARERNGQIGGHKA